MITTCATIKVSAIEKEHLFGSITNFYHSISTTSTSLVCLNPVLALHLSSTLPNASTALADMIRGIDRLVEYKYNHVMYKRKSPFSCTHDGSLVLASERRCGRQQDAGAAPTCPTTSRTSLLAVSVMRQITSCALPRHAPWHVTVAPRSAARQPRPRQRSAALVAATSPLLPRPTPRHANKRGKKC